MKINNLVVNILFKAINRKSALTKCALFSLTCLLIGGCAHQGNYQLAQSNQQIKQVQILDLNAPERNDGIINTLDGNYGKNVIRKYQRSLYDMKASRQMTQAGK